MQSLASNQTLLLNNLNSLEINRENKIKKIDEFFDELGYSLYHYFLLFVLILVFFADGTEVLVITLILKSLENEWNISGYVKSFIASSAFIGLMLGSLIASKYLDIYGRKKFLILGGVVVLIFGYFSALCNEVLSLLICRILMGIGIGAQIPAATNLASESIPTYNRSIYLANMWIAFPMGELYVCIIAMYVMPHFEYGQWRYVLIYCLIPVILCLITSLFTFESARFYLAHNEYFKATQIFRSLAKFNNKMKLDELRMYLIIKESEENPLNKYESNYSVLISNRFIRLSINSWIIWFVSSAGLYITVYMLPQILADKSLNLISVKSKKPNETIFVDIIISNLIATPKTILGGFLAEIKFLGRRYTILLSSAITAIASFFIIIDVSRITFYGGIIKLMTGVSMAVAKIYCTEAYPTKIRGLGYGTGHSVARFAGILVPFICEALRSTFGIFSPFYFVGFISILSCISCILLPFETLGRTLDTVDKEDLIELKNKDF